MIPFDKYHGAGNDFILIHKHLDRVSDRSEFAIAQCNRENGIGADGVLFLTIESTSSPPQITMDLRQPDGSTGPMCGNAARCAVKWASELLNKEEIILHTAVGTFPSKIVDGGDVQVEMDPSTFEPKSVPITSDIPFIDQDMFGLNITAINSGGVTQAVIFVDDITDPILLEKAFAIRHSEIFPKGTNVTFAQKIPNGFKQKTFERGVEGVTLACGTGACAIASVLHHSKQIKSNQSIRINQEGGEDLFVTINKTGSMILRGPATKQFSGEISPI